MKPYQQRVIDEQVELDNKINALALFLTTPEAHNLGSGDRARLDAQLFIMRKYSNILGERIVRFQ